MDAEYPLGVADNFRQEALAHQGENTTSIEEEVCRSRAAVVGVVALAGDAVPEPTRGRHLRRRKRAKEREPIVKAGR